MSKNTVKNFLKNLFPALNKFSKTWAGSYLFFIFLNWALLFAFRAAFLFIFRAGLTAEGSKYLLQAFYTGAKFDMRLACAVSIPFGLVLLAGAFFNLPKIARKITAWAYSFILTFIIALYALDIGYYQYLFVRVDASVLKFLEDAAISAQMIWETYPVIWGAIGLVIFLYAMYRFVLFLLNRVRPNEYKWKRTSLTAFGLLLLTGALMYGQFALYPLRWSNAYFSDNTFISHFTLNPVLNIYDTYRFAQEDTYDIDRLRRFYPLVSEYLGVDNPDAAALNFQRSFPAKDVPGSGFNVVIIIMESLAYNKTSLAMTELDPTPGVAKLAKESVLFNRFFTPTAGTARSVFTALNSLPDISSFKTSSRNPLIVNQRVIANDFKEYQKYYFIGGSASWGNIRGMLKNNISALKLYEENDYGSGNSTDVWGVSDLALFRFAAKELSKETKPFFAIIQTAGFHRPYTIPKERGDFELVQVDEEILRKHSFSAENPLDEYNALRFEDYSLSQFLAEARKEPYFDKTVFMIFGDHGLSAPQSENMPRGFQYFNIINHHVPLIIHAPFLTPQVISTAASEVDVMPTAAGLTGMAYTTRVMGRDLFGPAYKKHEGAFLFDSGNPVQPKFIESHYFYRATPGRRGLYDFTSEDYRQDLSSAQPERAEYMGNMADGLYEAARFMIFNNKKEEVK